MAHVKIPRHYADEEFDQDIPYARAVSNSSPVIHLSAIGRLHLLQQFSSVCIPPAVWREVVEEGGNRPGTGEVRRAREEGWLSVVEPGNTALVHLLKQDLYPGEAEDLSGP